MITLSYELLRVYLTLGRHERDIQTMMERNSSIDLGILLTLK